MVLLILLALGLGAALLLVECNTVEDETNLAAARDLPDQPEADREEIVLSPEPDLFDAATEGYSETAALDVSGGGGTDEIITLGGDDIIDLGEAGGAIGVDIQRAVAGDGDDWLIGGDDDDDLFGQAGNDVMLGGRGADLLSDGDPGAGRFATLTEPTTTDNDYFDGGSGDDSIVSAFGKDVLIGGRGDDLLDARDYGGQGFRDTVFGGRGDDTLYLDDGDLAEGGSGNDQFIVDLSASGINTEDHRQVEIYDFDADDDFLTLVLDDFSGNDRVTDVNSRNLFGGTEIVVRTDEGVFGTNEEVLLLRGVSGADFDELQERGGFRVQYT